MRQEQYDQLEKKYNKLEKEYQCIIDGEKNVCRKCRKSFSSNKFLKATDTILDTNGLMSICTNCINQEFNANFQKYSNDIERAILETCKILNVAYHPMAMQQAKSHIETLEARGTTVKAVFGIYVSKLFTVGKKNGISHFTYTGSPSETNDTIFKTSDEKEIAELQEEFGYGYDRDEYLNFKRKKDKLSSSYGEKTSIHTEWFDSYIIQKVKSEMCAAKGNVTESAKWNQMAEQSATAGKLKVSQLSPSEMLGGINLVPELVEAAEDYFSLIGLMPKIKNVPYDDADIIIWGIVSKIIENDGGKKPEYKEIYDFYDKFIEEYFEERGLTKDEIELEKKKRNNIFKDLGERYYEPFYNEGDTNG